MRALIGDVSGIQEQDTVSLLPGSAVGRNGDRMLDGSSEVVDLVPRRLHRYGHFPRCFSSLVYRSAKRLHPVKLRPMNRLCRFPPPISAAVICLNEQHNIGRCFDTLAWCDEIVIFDSGSTDQTLQPSGTGPHRPRMGFLRGCGTCVAAAAV